jgi:preprotein translocase subunit SecG
MAGCLVAGILFSPVQVAYNVLLAIGLIVAVVFSVLIYLTGKGDAMSGGSSVRTSFKGKASFDDFVSKMTLILGISFMVLMLIIDSLGNKIDKATGGSALPPPVDSPKTP